MPTISLTDLYFYNFFNFFLSDSSKSSFFLLLISDIMTVTSPLGLKLNLLISETFLYKMSHEFLLIPYILKFFYLQNI